MLPNQHASFAPWTKHRHAARLAVIFPSKFFLRKWRNQTRPPKSSTLPAHWRCGMADEGASSFSLLWEPVLNRHILREGLTEQTCVLEAGLWRLATDENGQAYVADENQSHWCQDMLEDVVLLHPEHRQPWVCLADETDMSLVEYQKRHRCVDICLPVAGTAEPVCLPAYMLRQPVAGARLLWSLKDLYDNVVGKKAEMTASRWMNSWWPWWLKSLQHFGMTDAHLRRAANSETDEKTRYRIFEKPVMSTFALVLFMTKWSSPSKSGTSKNEAAQAAWTSLLEALMKKLASQEPWSLPVFLDVQAESRMGQPTAGRSVVLLPVQNGAIDVTQVHQCEDPQVRASLAKLVRGARPSMPLPQWLRALDGAGRKVWLLKQVVNYLGCRLETVFAEDFSRSAAKSSEVAGEEEETAEQALCTALSARAQRRRDKFASGVSLTSHVSQARTLLKYFYEVRKRVRGSRVLHLAFDASRVGGWQALFGFLTTGSGMAAWLAPQAGSVQKRVLNMFYFPCNLEPT